MSAQKSRIRPTSSGPWTVPSGHLKLAVGELFAIGDHATENLIGRHSIRPTTMQCGHKLVKKSAFAG